jgi:hypothetical protein
MLSQLMNHLNTEVRGLDSGNNTLSLFPIIFQSARLTMFHRPIKDRLVLRPSLNMYGCVVKQRAILKGTLIPPF